MLKAHKIPVDTPRDQLMTDAAAAEYHDVTRQTVWNLARDKDWGYIQDERGKLYLAADVRATPRKHDRYSIAQRRRYHTAEMLRQNGVETVDELPAERRAELEAELATITV